LSGCIEQMPSAIKAKKLEPGGNVPSSISI